MGPIFYQSIEPFSQEVIKKLFVIKRTLARESWLRVIAREP